MSALRPATCWQPRCNCSPEDLGCPGTWVPRLVQAELFLLCPQEAPRTRKKADTAISRLQDSAQFCRLLDWLPLTPMWVQYLKFSRPHDQYSVQDGAETGTGTRTTCTVAAQGCLPRSASDHPPSVRDQQPIRLHVHTRADNLSICPHRPQGTMSQAVQAVARAARVSGCHNLCDDDDRHRPVVLA